MNERALGELVTIRSTAGLDLDGLLFWDDTCRSIVIHVHGSFGNFYQNHFLRRMAHAYPLSGMGLLAVNLAGHDGLAEGYRNSKNFEYVGGAIADFEECVSDIGGAVIFAEQLAERVILQGHSLGCDRVLHFLITRRALLEFILLSPCDSYKLHANWIAPETVEAQLRRIKSNSPQDPYFDWLPSREYGVRGGGDWTYPIPITRNAFLSIAEGPPHRLIRIEQPADFLLEQRALLYVGGRDALQVWPQDVMFEYLKRRIPRSVSIFDPSGDHMLKGCEDDVVRRIVAWACA